MRSTGKLRFLIAFGPTEEPLDPVRFLTNNSTGMMGRYLIQAAKKKGHSVTAIECPSQARTALDLQKKLHALISKNDVLIMVAAVCDVRPAKFSTGKIKKDAFSSIQVVKNPDILAGLAKKKKKGQIFVGFGVESERLLENGRKKLKAKKLDAIVLQKASAKKHPFGEQAIEAYLMDSKGDARRFPSIQKNLLSAKVISLAERLVKEVVLCYIKALFGAMAEQLGSGLQNRVHRCDSGSRLVFDHGRVVEWHTRQT